MKIGLLSDSHGRVHPTREAVAAVVANGAELLLHMGDIGSDKVLEELVGHNARIVFGNCDDEIESLSRYARALGISVDHPCGWLELQGKHIAYTHGHMPELMKQAIARGASYLIHGHTHEVADVRAGCTRIINPGALWRAPRYTAATLDLESDSLEIIEVKR